MKGCSSKNDTDSYTVLENLIPPEKKKSLMTIKVCITKLGANCEIIKHENNKEQHVTIRRRSNIMTLLIVLITHIFITKA